MRCAAQHKIALAALRSTVREADLAAFFSNGNNAMKIHMCEHVYHHDQFVSAMRQHMFMHIHHMYLSRVEHVPPFWLQ